MEVYIVRHTSVDVPPAICYGQTDVPVREDSFLQEAEAVKETLATLTFEAVFTDARRDARLKELDFGEWEWTFIYENPSPEVHYWFNHQVEARTPGGESFLDMQARLSAFIEEQRPHYQRICLFAHGGIHLCAQLLRGVKFDNDLFMHLPPYGSVVKYDF